MDFTKILSVSGKPGLFKVVSQLKHAMLVESLIDKKRFPAFGNEKISTLEEIAVFTKGEDRPLKDVLKTLFEKLEGKPAIDPKADFKELKAFFENAVPNYDPERVYPSDIKKIISWYNLLLENDLLDFTEEKEAKTEENKPPEVLKEEPLDTPEAKAEAGKSAKKSKKTVKEKNDEKPGNGNKPKATGKSKSKGG